jgi:phosphodiesterase/alkaline phosphatase D-like protein
MVQKYERQFAVPEFKAVADHMRAKNGFYAIWDDHDFAWDNARGGEMISEEDIAKKEFSRQCFHKYLNCSTNTPEVYYYIDTPLARVIFLDNRYYATKNTLINDDQLAFLERHFSDHNLPYTIVCAGLTLHNAHENWTVSPDSEKRLYEILNSKNKGVIFLSGDMHANRFHDPFTYRDKTATFYELVASGAAINKIGLPFKFDNLQNWGLLHLQPGQFKCVLYTRADSPFISETVFLNDWPAPRTIGKKEWKRDHRPW